MNLTDKQKRIIVLGIGIFFLVMGLIQAILKVEFNENIMQNVQFVLMLVALYLILSTKKLGRKSSKRKEQSSDVEEINETDAEEDNTKS